MKRRLTAHQRATKAAIKAWWRKHYRGTPLKDVRHIHPICYVIGLAAPACLVVAMPWTESEAHMQQWDRANPLTTVNRFDQTLALERWCSVGYVAYNGGGMSVAIPIVKYPK